MPISATVKTFDKAFDEGGEKFYQLLNSKKLTTYIDLLKGTLTELTELTSLSKKEEDDLKDILDFFGTHGFWYTAAIKNAADFTTNARNGTDSEKQNYNDYVKNIIRLLNLDIDILTSAFATIDEKGDDDYQTRLQAKAFLGKLAMNTVSKVSALATYHYGLYLAKYPQHQQNLQAYCEKRNFKAAKLHEYFCQREGLYWLRIAAVVCDLDAAKKAISKFRDEKSTRETEKFQLHLALEQMGEPIVEGDKYSEGQNMIALIPPGRYMYQRMTSIFSTRMYVKSGKKGTHVVPLLENFLSTTYEGERNFIKSILYYLMLVHDPLLPDDFRYRLTETIKNYHGGLFMALTYHAGQDNSQKRLAKYHDKPFAIEIINDLLPLLNKEDKAWNTVTLDEHVKMQDHSVEMRESVFRQHVFDALHQYIETGELFGAKLPKETPKPYVRALIHETISRSVEHFKLEQDNELVASLEGFMNDMKSKELADAYRRVLATNPNHGFKQAITNRLKSYAATAHVANTSKLTPLEKFAEQNGSEKHPTSQIKKVAYAGAALIEGAHVLMPVLLVGVPWVYAPAAAYIAIKGLAKALHAIHSQTDWFVRVVHTHHFAHEGGMIAHGGDHTHSKAYHLDTLKHFNTLLEHAAVDDIDNVLILMHHWAGIYEPVTSVLTEASNQMFGEFLVELLLNSLTRRLMTEAQAAKRTITKPMLPQNIPELLDYFDKTLWSFSHPSTADNIQLLTKDQQIINSLDVVFPVKLQAHFAGKVIDVGITPACLPPLTRANRESDPVRFASPYEVKLINDSRKPSTSQHPFALSNNGHESFLGREALELQVAYKEWKTLRLGIKFLSHSNSLQALLNRASVIPLDSLRQSKDFNPTEKEKLNKIVDALSILKNIIHNSMNDSSLPYHTLDNWAVALKTTLGVTSETLVTRYLDRIEAEIILLAREHQLINGVISCMRLASTRSEILSDLIKSSLTMPLALEETLTKLSPPEDEPEDEPEEQSALPEDLASEPDPANTEGAKLPSEEPMQAARASSIGLFQSPPEEQQLRRRQGRNLSEIVMAAEPGSCSKKVI